MNDQKPIVPTMQAIVPYDEHLLERARTQWQFGDWESLTSLDRDVLQSHPDRAKLAVLAAAGHLQLGRISDAKEWLQLHKDWGGDSKLLARILIANLHICLGRFCMAFGQESRAVVHFEEAVRIASPNVDAKLFGETAAIRAAARMGLLQQAVRLMGNQIERARVLKERNEARLAILEAGIDLLNHELSLAQQRQQLYRPLEKQSALNNRSEWVEQIRMRSVSQLGQDLWVLEKTNYKRGGYFVEVGASDGVLLSNTWLLEKGFDWQGICVEANPNFYEKLKKNRACTVSNQFIGRVTGEDIEFILADVYGGDRRFAGNDSHEQKRAAYAALGNVMHMKAISLHDFLLQHAAPRTIDYMSIDTEGSEYHLLSTFPFEEWDIRLLTIEHNFAPQREHIVELLSRNGYRRIERDWEDWYEKKS